MTNLNDPKLWKNIDWDEPQIPDLLKKTDTLIEQQSRGSRLKDIRGQSWKNNKTEAMQELAQNPNWLSNQAIGAKKRRESYYDNEEKKQAAIYKRESNEDYKQRRAEKNRIQVNDPAYVKSHSEGVARRDADPEYHKSLLKGAEEKLMRKGFIVTPAGIHLRQPESATANNISVRTLQQRIKSNPKEYYYISQEKYIMLTGKEI